MRYEQCTGTGLKRTWKQEEHTFTQLIQAHAKPTQVLQNYEYKTVYQTIPSRMEQNRYHRNKLDEYSQTSPVECLEQFTIISSLLVTELKDETEDICTSMIQQPKLRYSQSPYLGRKRWGMAPPDRHMDAPKYLFENGALFTADWSAYSR